jgi:hypothetical protein
MTTSSSFKKFSHLAQQSRLAWQAIGGFILISTFLILAGAAQLLLVFFLLGSFCIGVFLYFRTPLLYVGFTWWLWFLTPLVRRLSDWRSGSYLEPHPLLLAPYLVTLITLVTLWKHLPKVYRQGDFPFVMSFVGIAYGLIVGLIFRAPKSLLIVGLDWTVPVLFGFHLFVNWRNYPSYRRNIQQVFLWGVLIMGVYGVIQFCFAPAWDTYWLAKSGFESGSVGFAENASAFSINVWSTMTSNRPFGTVIMAGLILLLVNERKGNLAVIATVPGYLAFLLARKRTAWMSWLISLLALISSLKPQIQKRIIVSVTVSIILIVPVSQMQPFSEFISSRFDTFSDLEEDNSANARLGKFQETSNDALVSFLGQGIGGKSLDSGILSSLFDLGWFGSIFYFGGMGLLFLKVFQKTQVVLDPFINASRAISFSVLMQLPLGRSHIEAQGLILWSFLCIAIAGKKYYHHKLNNDNPPPVAGDYP